jgi:hypothetical protein
MHLRQLAILPAPDTQQKSHNIALLFAVKLLNVFVGPHDEGAFKPKSSLKIHKQVH